LYIGINTIELTHLSGYNIIKMSDYAEIIFDDEWKVISGMSNYEVSYDGRIRIRKTSKIMKQRIVGDYMGVKITMDNSERKYSYPCVRRKILCREFRSCKI